MIRSRLRSRRVEWGSPLEESGHRCVAVAGPVLRGIALRKGSALRRAFERFTASWPAVTRAVARFRPGASTTVLLLMPPVWLVLDPDAFFPGSRRDPWLYLGYSLFLPDHLRQFPDFYCSSRLPVTLPGFLLHRLLPPLAAYILLHFLVAWTALLAFRGAAEALVGRAPALLAALALGTHLFFVIAVGRNYVDGFGIAYFLLALLALSKARPERPSAGFAAAGAVSVALVGSNLFYVVLLPWLFGYAHAVRRGRGGRLGVGEAKAYLAGAVASLLFFGAVSAWFGGHWFLFQSSLEFLRAFTPMPGIFVTPVSTWLSGATWLAMPLTLVLTSSACLIRARREPLPGVIAYAHWQWLAFAAVMVSFQLGSHPVLQYPFYASLLLPPAYLALAGTFAGCSPASERSVFLLGSVALVLALPTAAGFHLDVARLFGPVLLLPVVAGLLLPLIALWRRRDVRAVACMLAALALVQWLTTVVAFDREWERFTKDRRGVFLQVVGVLAAIERFSPPPDYLFWYNVHAPGEPGELLFDAVGSTRLLCLHVFSRRFPQTDGPVTCSGQPIQPGMKIVVLSRRVRVFRQARRALRSIGWDAKLLGEAEAPGPIPTVAITYLEITG